MGLEDVRLRDVRLGDVRLREVRLRDVGLGDVGLGDVGLGKVRLGDVGLEDVGRGRGILGTHGTRGRDKQTTPDICADFVEYNFRWSRLAVADGFQRLETVKNIVSSYGGLSL